MTSIAACVFIVAKTRIRRAFGLATICLLFFHSAIYASGAPRTSANRYADIISDGKAEISIIANATPEANAAAELLKDALEKMSETAEISISGGEYHGAKKLTIHITNDKNAAPLTPDTRNIDAALKFKFKIYPQSIYIEYPNEDSAINAVGLFLKKFCGVFFFAPGPIGSEIPRMENLKIRTGSFEITPSYKGRNLGIYSNENFAKLLGHSSDFTASNHSIPQIIDKKTAEKHPEWMAKIDGILQPHKNHAQIDFANGAARTFIKECADKYFTEAPSSNIFALTPADSSDFDNTPYSERFKRGFTPNGYRDCSNLVFSFTNDIARFLKSKHPSKFVYSLAYLYTENPPSFKLSDNIIVYLCQDRGNFFSDKKKEEHFELLKKWSQSGTRFFGIYDYNYGSQYFIPRNISEQIAHSIKTSHDIGARFYTCESFPNWAYDAHKIWLVSNLLIDVSSDPKELEAEFFDRYYKESSEYVRAFFDIAQKQWNNRRDRPMWLTLFKRWEQAEIFSEESLQSMEKNLEMAELSAVSPLVAERVKEIRLMFNITKSFARTYELQKKLWLCDIDNTPRELLLDAVDAVKISKSNLNLHVRLYNENTKYPKASFTIWNKLDYMDPSEMLLARLENPGEKRPINMLKDCGFKSAFTGANGPWKFRKSDNANLKIKKSSGLLSVSAWLPAYLYQGAEISPGKKYSFKIETSGNLEIGAVLYIELSFYDKSGKLLTKKRLRIPPLGNFANKQMSISQTAPRNSKYAIAAIFAMSMRDSDFAEIRNAELLEEQP